MSHATSGGFRSKPDGIRRIIYLNTWLCDQACVVALVRIFEPPSFSLQVHLYIRSTSHALVRKLAPQTTRFPVTSLVSCICYACCSWTPSRRCKSQQYLQHSYWFMKSISLQVFVFCFSRMAHATYQMQLYSYVLVDNEKYKTALEPELRFFQISLFANRKRRSNVMSISMYSHLSTGGHSNQLSNWHNKYARGRSWCFTSLTLPRIVDVL